MVEDGQLIDFMVKRGQNRHYVRFGRGDSEIVASPGHHYVRFGRDVAPEPEIAAEKKSNKHYVRFGRDAEPVGVGADEKRAHYVRFGRNGGELGLQIDDDRRDEDFSDKADKRQSYVRFG